MAEIPKAKGAYAFFQQAMHKKMSGQPLGMSPAPEARWRRAPSFEFPRRRAHEGDQRRLEGPR